MNLADVGSVVEFKDVHQSTSKNVDHTSYNSIDECCPRHVFRRVGGDGHTAGHDSSQDYKYLNVCIQIDKIRQLSQILHHPLILKVGTDAHVSLKDAFLLLELEKLKIPSKEMRANGTSTSCQ
jgi:hypothetical protein